MPHLHGECLARAGLAVRKDAHIVAVDARLHEWRHVGEHLRLRALRAKHAIELDDGQKGMDIKDGGRGND